MPAYKIILDNKSILLEDNIPIVNRREQGDNLIDNLISKVRQRMWL